jgi:hypothetical protein
MPRQQQQSEDAQTLLRALVKLKAAAGRGLKRDSVVAAAALEEAVTEAEKRRSICAGTAQARECLGSRSVVLLYASQRHIIHL